MNINAIASNPINISTPVKSSIEENIKEKPLQPKAATEPVYTEKQLANLRILNCSPNTSDRFNMNKEYNRQDDPFGNGAPLKKNECCWSCRSYDMAYMSYEAKRLVKRIDSELQNFRQILAKEFPELSGTPFEFTIDENGRIRILESDLLSRREIALLTESIQEYEPLKNVITAHAKLIIDFANNLKTPEGKEALSYKNFSTLVNYTNLLAHTTDEFNIFGQPNKDQRMHFTDRNMINVRA
jgi:hypothetical protein